MKKLVEGDDQNMYLLYFLLTENLNEKLNQNYIWQILHKREGERNMHSPYILEGDEWNKKNRTKW